MVKPFSSLYQLVLSRFFSMRLLCRCSSESELIGVSGPVAEKSSTTMLHQSNEEQQTLKFKANQVHQHSFLRHSFFTENTPG